MLIRYGAKPEQFCVSRLDDDVLRNLIREKHDYTFSFLQNARGDAETCKESTLKAMDEWKFSEFIGRRYKEASILALSEPGTILPEASSTELFKQCIARRDYHLIQEMARLGANILPVPGSKGVCGLGLLVRGGYATLFNKIGTMQSESALAKGGWHTFKGDSRAGLWFAKKDITKIDKDFSYPEPFLLVAVKRELPNMDTVRLLVEKFAVDVNELHYTYPHGDDYDSDNDDDRVTSKGFALHFIARGNSWWHVHQALP